MTVLGIYVVVVCIVLAVSFAIFAIIDLVINLEGPSRGAAFLVAAIFLGAIAALVADLGVTT